MPALVLAFGASNAVARSPEASPRAVDRTTVATLAATAAPIVVHDDRGVAHAFAQPPRRIVSLLPSLTESLAVLGAADRLVGVDRYANWPVRELAGLPRLGGLDDARLEAIVALRPDVVLASTSARVLDRLDALGLRVVRLRSDTHADLRRTFEQLGTLLGTPDAAASAWQSLARGIDAQARRLPPGWRGARVYFEVGGGAYAAGASSFIGETLSALGLANAVDAALGPFPKLNPEAVVRAAPDVILGRRADLLDVERRPGWGALDAVRHGRVCRFDAAQGDVLVRPGPRLADAAAIVVDCLAKLPPPAAASGARR